MGQAVLFELTEEERNPEGWAKQCHECGDDFQALAKHAKYCGADCKAEYHRKKPKRA